MVGLDLPVVSMEHQYLVTEAIPEIAAHGRPLPIVRDPDVSWYLRQERAGLLLGPYEWDCKLAWDGKEPPPEFGRELFADDLDRLERYIEDAVARVPVFGTAGVTRVVNGPIPYTPDGNPLIGPAYGLPNFYLCCAFSFGIVQAGGAGKAMAEWIVEGEPEWDLWGLDPRRYTDYANQAYTRAKARELYQNEYAIAFPFEERPAGRPARTTPLYETLRAKGAMFGARGGWERATWFVPPGEAAEQRLSFHRTNWFAAVGEECRAVRERVGVLDLGGFAKFEVSGDGAAAYLDRLICGRLPEVGRVALAYMCTPQRRHPVGAHDHPARRGALLPVQRRERGMARRAMAAPPSAGGRQRTAARCQRPLRYSGAGRPAVARGARPDHRGRSVERRLSLARGALDRDRLRQGPGAAHQLRRRARLGAAPAARVRSSRSTRR